MPKKTEYVLASGNQHKLAEIRAILGPHFLLTAQSKFNVTDVEETGLTFVENAIIKARHTALQTDLPVIADDSGLEVDALKGAPGIHSARYAGADASDVSNVNKLMKALEGVPADLRTARFQCVIVVLNHADDPTPLICQGTWSGRIAETSRGLSGFGYDPVFLCPEYGLRAAELDPDVKNRISHRALALARLVSTILD